MEVVHSLLECFVLFDTPLENSRLLGKSFNGGIVACFFPVVMGFDQLTYDLTILKQVRGVLCTWFDISSMVLSRVERSDNDIVDFSHYCCHVGTSVSL